MVNQWGRDGQVSGGGAGAGAIITVAVISLLIGSAAGYGGARYLGLLGRPAETVIAPKALPGPELALAEKAKVEAQTALRQAEQELTRSTSRISGLEADLRDAESRLKALQAKTEIQCPPATNATNEACDPQLRQRVEVLEEEARDYVRQIDAARDELAAVRKERNQLLIDNREAVSELGSMRMDAVTMKYRLGAIEAANRKLEADLETVSQERDAADGNWGMQLNENSRMAMDNVALRWDVVKLTKALEEANGKLASSAASAQQAVEPKDPDSPKGSETVSSREPSAVDNALSRAPGLKALDATQRQLVEEKLRDGACVTDALEQVFSRVPVLTLRSLIRDLDSPC